MGGGAGGGAAAAAAAGRDPKAAEEERGAEDFGLTALSWLVREQDKLLGQATLPLCTLSPDSSPYDSNPNKP